MIEEKSIRDVLEPYKSVPRNEGCFYIDVRHSTCVYDEYKGHTPTHIEPTSIGPDGWPLLNIPETGLIHYLEDLSGYGNHNHLHIDMEYMINSNKLSVDIRDGSRVFTSLGPIGFWLKDIGYPKVTIFYGRNRQGLLTLHEEENHAVGPNDQLVYVYIPRHIQFYALLYIPLFVYKQQKSLIDRLFPHTVSTSNAYPKNDILYNVLGF